MKGSVPTTHTSREFRFASLTLVFCLCFDQGQGTAFGQEVVDVQFRRKAEMLYSLGSLIQPPAGFAAGDDSVIIGVLGQDPFVGQDELRRTVNHLDEEVRKSNASRAKNRRKRIVVKRFASARDYTPCHILFVSAKAAEDSEEKTVEDRLAAALKRTKGSGVLIVGDTAGLAAKGATVNFYVTEAAGVSKVRFEFNPNAARRAGLTKIHSGVYRLAKIVKGE